MDELNDESASQQAQGDANEVRRRNEERDFMWTLPRLRAACGRNRIYFEETTELERLRGFVVTYGRTSMIGIKQTLSEQDKIWTLAHELAHVALGHIHDDADNGTGYLPERDVAPMEVTPTETMVVRDKAEEREAHIWAAHLLIAPEVFSARLKDAQATQPNAEDALAEAKRQTSRALNVPFQLVDFWYEHREHRFAVSPRDWLTE